MNSHAPPNSSNSTPYRRALWLLIGGTALIRLALAFHLELTSDECNGWIYARFPSLSYFDHPPLWGYLIWLTTGGAHWANEGLVRLSAVLLSAATTLLLFRFVSEMLNPRAAWFAALLYNLSFLFTAIGFVILPDTPLYFFWLLTLYGLWKAFAGGAIGTVERRWVLLAGVAL